MEKEEEFCLILKSWTIIDQLIKRYRIDYEEEIHGLVADLEAYILTLESESSPERKA